MHAWQFVRLREVIRTEAQRHLQLMLNASFGKNLADEAISNASSPLRERIKALCHTAESRVSTDPAQAGVLAEQLLRDATPLLVHWIRYWSLETRPATLRTTTWQNGR